MQLSTMNLDVIHSNHSQNLCCQSSMLKSHEDQICQNQNQSNFMDHFIQQKYSQVTDLQKYLVQELQFIENAKDQQKNIEKIIQIKVLPTLTEVKLILQTVKTLIQPLLQLTTNAMQAISLKCKDLLEQKQHKCCRFEQEIEHLKKQVKQAKEQKYKGLKQNCKKVAKLMVRNDEQKEQLPEEKDICIFGRHKNIEKEESNQQSKPTRNASRDRMGNTPYLNHDVKFAQKQSSPPKFGTKNKPSPIKLEFQHTKDQIPSPSVLKSRNININYRCDKPAAFERISHSKSIEKVQDPKKHPRNEDYSQATRKDYIKQKIQNIKMKSDQKNTQSRFK